MWKILTAKIRDEIYYWPFLVEQKGCCKRTKGTDEQLYIDEHILIESKTRRKNLALACKMAYDMVPKARYYTVSKMYKIPNEVIKFMKKTMASWRVELTGGAKNLAEVKIQGGVL